MAELIEGSEPMSSARLMLHSLTFSDGTRIDVPDNAALVIVGPNNSGKSRALQNIKASVLDEGQQIWVCKAEYAKAGTLEQLRAQLKPYFGAIDGNINNSQYIGPNFTIHPSHVEGWWNGRVSQLGHFFTLLLDTATRLGGCGPGSAHATGMTRPRDAFQMLYDDPSLETKISDIFRNAFGLDLIIDPRSGSHIPIYVGVRPALKPPEMVHTPSYLQKIRSLPLLHEQGDGIKSFAAILLAVKVMPRSMILIDEPEAFLHPPQERRVGQLLAEEQPSNCQLVVATHSEDVIQGLLAKHSDRAVIVRLVRSGNKNIPTVLRSDQVAQLWNSPVLRYSNILSGLFHDGVIIAESDGDCRFYEAISHAVQEQDVAGPDLFYTHSGGKDRMPILIDALKAVGVPVRVIADVDILRDELLLAKIIKSLGGVWENHQHLWSAAKKTIEDRKNWFRAGDLRQRIDQVLSKLDKEGVVDNRTLDAIRRLSRQTSPWSEIKSNGIPGPLTGEAALQVNKLIEEFRRIGLFVVPVGELERFVKTVGGHGPAWVEEALAKDLKRDPELREARDFVMSLLNSFEIAQTAITLSETSLA